MRTTITCPACGAAVERFRNPIPTVDILIDCVTPEGRRGIVLIERRNEPYGWAIPGGFVDYGESAEDAAAREALEETSLQVHLLRQFHTYSRPGRDPRQHTLSVVFLATAHGSPRAASDAAAIGLFGAETLPRPLAFDHAEILDDFFAGRY
ncbi:MAG: NUDIX hydrolase [Candidatus Tectomicrobia bacterium]|nr:NUDIX hydrolase [Candidatus Tectomicrobia bacterium]